MPSSRRTFLAGAATLAGATTGLFVRTTSGQDRETVTGTWPEYGHGPTNAGRTSARGPVGHPGERWHAEAGIPVRKTPTVADGRLFVGGLDEMLALDAATGERVWSVPLERRSRFNEAAAAVRDGTVYVPFSETLYAFDASDGTERWSRTLADEQRPPTVVDDTVYALAGDGGTLHALDREDGTERWRRSVGQFASGAPAVGDGTVVAPGWSREAARDESAESGEETSGRSETAALVALDADDGAERWRYDLTVTGEREVRFESVALGGGRVYAGSHDGGVHAVDVSTGERVWRFDPETTAPVPREQLYDDRDPRPARVWAGLAVADGTVYVPHGDGRLYALEAATGQVRWSFRSWGRFSAAPSVGERAVYVASEDTFVYALDPETGERLWEFSLPERVDGSAPAVVDGHLFVGCADRRVYALWEVDG